MTMIVMLNNTIEYDEVRFHERHDSIISAVRSLQQSWPVRSDQGGCCVNTDFIKYLCNQSENIRD